MQQIKIVKTLFHIGTDEYQEGNAVLLLEIGTDHINYSWYQDVSNALVELKYCSIDEFELKSALESILEETKKYIYLSGRSTLLNNDKIIA